MKYTTLGSSDLTASKTCMGRIGFGDVANGQYSWTTDEEHSREIIRWGLELGVNFSDTATAYQCGISEQYLGRVIRDFARREDIVIATKFLPRAAADIENGIPGQQHIQRMMDKSLQNLGMDCVDPYIYHVWDYQTLLQDVLDELNHVVKQGKTRCTGISNCFAWQLAKANVLAEKEGLAKPIPVQGHYNLTFREEERETAQLCRGDNIAMTPYSALAGGRLGKHPGKTSKRLTEDSYTGLKYDATAGADSRIIARVAELADSKGVSMMEVALAWLMQKVASPAVGATKLHHIEGTVKAAELSLSGEEMTFLEELYVLYVLVGVMAQNMASEASKPHVWSTGNQRL